VTTSVDRLLAAARARLGARPGPDDLDRLQAEGALVVDIRPAAERTAEGALPGAVVVERNVLEWRLAPDGEHRLADAGPADRTVVLVCNDGYASTLAAVVLRDLGLPHATDLDGGYRAWRRARDADQV
jgi:rhodanese-related sulfurtransferase